MATFEHPFDSGTMASALASFSQDARAVDAHGTLLNYLIDRDRPAEARLVLDEPGQLNFAVLQTAFQKLAHHRARDWSMVLARRPKPEPVFLSFAGFRATDEGRLARAVELLIAQYGLNLPLRSGQTLLHVAARSAVPGVIERVLAAGASPAAVDDLGQTPFDELVDSVSFGRANAQVLRRLSQGTLSPRLPVLAQFLAAQDLLVTQGVARPIAELVEVLESLLELGASAAPFQGRTPLEAALCLRLPRQDRARVIELLLAKQRAGATFAEVLPGVVAALWPDNAADAFERAGARPGARYGKDRRTLLHVACAGISDLDDLPEDGFVEERVAPLLTWLLRLGESPAATDARGKTPAQLARRGLKELPPHARERVAALLSAPAGEQKAKKRAPRAKPPARPSKQSRARAR